MAMVPNVLLPNFIPFALNADPHKCLVNPFTLDLDDLTLVGAKDIGTKAGGIYEDRAGSKWYVKVTEDLNIPEFLTSRVLQYLVPRNTSPVYFIKGKPGWVASKEIPGFRSQIDTVSRGKTIEADQTEIAHMLLKAGANPEQTVHERPLHLAIKRDNVVLARELSTTYPHKKWTLIDKALECKSGKIIRELAPQWMLDAAPVQRKYLEDLMQKP